MDILYLNNRYIVSRDELKGLIEDSPSVDSVLGIDLLAALKDGIIYNWLMNGSNEDQDVASKLPSDYCDGSDTVLMHQLAECFATEYRVKPMSLGDYLVLRQIDCSFGDSFKRVFVAGTSPVIYVTEKGYMNITLSYEILREIGEYANVYMTIKACKKEPETSLIEEISLKSKLFHQPIVLPESIYLCIDLFLKAELEIYADFLGNTFPLWQCTLQKLTTPTYDSSASDLQRKCISDILKKMQFVDSSAPFYISKPVTIKESSIILYDEYNEVLEPQKGNGMNLEIFVNKIRKFSGLRLIIPTKKMLNDSHLYSSDEVYSISVDVDTYEGSGEIRLALLFQDIDYE